MCKCCDNTMFIESATDRRRGGSGAVQELESLARRHLEARERTAALVVHGADSQHDRCSRSDSLVKENGACAVLMRPIEGQRLLADPYFYPIYDEAQKLDLAIAIHIANGNPWLTDLYNHPVRIASTFHRFRIPYRRRAFNDIIIERDPRCFSQAPFWLHRSQRAVAALGDA